MHRCISCPSAFVLTSLNNNNITSVLNKDFFAYTGGGSSALMWSHNVSAVHISEIVYFVSLTAEWILTILDMIVSSGFFGPIRQQTFQCHDLLFTESIHPGRMIEIDRR